MTGAFVSFHQNLFALTSRSILRTQWKINFEQMLQALPLRSMSRHYLDGLSSIGLDTAEVVEHPSLLLRAIAGTSPWRMMTFHDGINIFVDLYLKEFPEADSIDFGIRDGIKEAMERQRRWESEDGSNDELYED
ncbi:MAG: hypothetical protein HZA15_14715 [Nitrospirae bacterium]|nr:hypothetical protein [Nitrospirota bacterium]